MRLQDVEMEESATGLARTTLTDPGLTAELVSMGVTLGAAVGRAECPARSWTLKGISGTFRAGHDSLTRAPFRAE